MAQKTDASRRTRGAERVDRAVHPGQLGRPDQHGDAGKAHQHAQHDHPGRAVGSAHPIDEDHPQRRRPDDEGRHAGNDALLSPHHAAVAAQEEKEPDDGGRAPVDQARRRVPAQAAPDVEDRPGEEEAEACHQEGRHGLDGEANGQVGGAPDDVDAEHGAPDGEQTGGRFLRRYGGHKGSCFHKF